MPDQWNSSDAYERFMGRWSKTLAPLFIQWLDFPPDKDWLEIGCGTGALTDAIRRTAQSHSLTSIDPSPAFLQLAQERIPSGVEFIVAGASDVPKADNSFDVIVSGLAINFFPDIDKAFSEMKRV